MKKVIFALALISLASFLPICAVKPAITVQMREDNGTKHIIDFSDLSQVPEIKVGTIITVVIEDTDGKKQTVKGTVLNVF